jgi:hypothetical protein
VAGLEAESAKSPSNALVEESSGRLVGVSGTGAEGGFILGLTLATLPNFREMISLFPLESQHSPVTISSTTSIV